MTTKTALAALSGLAALACLSTGWAREPATILPGQWEYTLKVGGIIPAGTESRCLTPKDVETFSNSVCTRRFRCVYDRNIVGGGKIDLQGVWYDKKNRPAPVKAKGEYAPEKFTLNINVKTIHGLPLAGVMKAERVAAQCPSAAAQ